MSWNLTRGLRYKALLLNTLVEENLEEWPWLTDEILSHHYVYINNEDSTHLDQDSHQYEETNVHGNEENCRYDVDTCQYH